MESFTQTFGRIVRERRLKLGMTQAKLASLIGKKQSQIVRMERGVVDPRLSNVVEIANGLGMEIVAVPLILLPAVRHLIKMEDGTAPKRSRLVGNDPEDAEEDDDEL